MSQVACAWEVVGDPCRRLRVWESVYTFQNNGRIAHDEALGPFSEQPIEL